LKNKILLILIILGLANSCDKTVFNPIPNSTVLLYLHLDTDAYDMRLKAVNSAQTYDKSVLNPSRAFNSIERTGYGGILVFHGQENGADAFFAYDMACPNEASPSVKVAVENTLFARCPKCKTKYEIWAGVGNPVEGPSKYSLKRYTNVSNNGNTVTIYN
jgi:nitrite reductase/ring-hydroxylating ferredoxin subunit